MATFSVVLEVVLNTLRLCNNCCKEDTKEKKHAEENMDKDDGMETEELASENGSDSEKGTQSENTTKHKEKPRKKRNNGYSAVKLKECKTTELQQVIYDNQINPTINIINHQPQPAPVYLPGMPAWASPPANPGQSEPAALSTDHKSLVEWVPSSIKKAAELADRAIYGGYDIDETELWVIRARLKGEIIPGKLNYHHNLGFVLYKKDESYAERNVDVFEIQPSHGVLYVTYGYKVYAHKFYEVMCIE